MPIKGFKGFNRRKSIGIDLNEAATTDAPAPAVSSFRVLERPHYPSKSFDGGHSLLRATAEARPASAGLQDDFQRRPHMDRGSNGTQNSAWSADLYNSSSSAHYSSTSTLPSATSEVSYDDSYGHPMAKAPPLHTDTAPPGFFRSAFTGRKSGVQPVPVDIQLPQHSADYSNIPDIRSPPRQRAMTDTSHTSESTATPSGFLGHDMGYEDSDDFGNMFSGIGPEARRPPVVMESPASMGPTGGHFFASERRDQQRPANSLPVSPAALSGNGFSSRDGLLGTTPKQEAKGLRRKPSPVTYASAETLEPPRSTPSPGSSAASQSPRIATGLRERNLIPGGRTPPPHQRNNSESLLHFADDDMVLAMQYIDRTEPSPSPPPPSKTATPPALQSARTSRGVSPYPEVEPHLPIDQFRNATHQLGSPVDAETNSIMMTPKLAERAFPEPDQSSLRDDASMQEIALYAERLEEERSKPAPPKPKPVTTGKVMTPAQFERYKKEQENRQLVEGSDSDSEPEDSDKDDADDEEERNREMARHRRKQEADLAVYRQKMMKITGESGSSQQRPGSKSVTNLASQIPSISFEDRSGAKSDDEDEDVPLGILAAHGFPSRNRPPSHMEGGRASVQYTSEAYPEPGPAPSVSGQSNAGGPAAGGKVPAFAKNLPKDPFYGASLVTPADRQSLAFNSGASTHGGSQSGGAAAGAPPGGLVGVIAKEERARAIRRGSPNANTSFEASNAAVNGLGPTPGLPAPMSAEQAQQAQQMAHMTQMMQVQMQWMQQMMSMQRQLGGQGPPPPPHMQGMPGMPGMSPPIPGTGLRPASTFPTRPSPSAIERTQRSTTSLGIPCLQPPPPGYASSLAPSERSSIGQPSRYRPVSTAPDALPSQHGRTNSLGSHGWDPRGRASPSARSGIGAPLSAPHASGAPPPPAHGRPASRAPLIRTSDEDDEDEQGWAAMRAAREQKRGRTKSMGGRRAALGAGEAEAEDDLAGLARGVIDYGE